MGADKHTKQREKKRKQQKIPLWLKSTFHLVIIPVISSATAQARSVRTLSPRSFRQVFFCLDALFSWSFCGTLGLRAWLDEVGILIPSGLGVLRLQHKAVCICSMWPRRRPYPCRSVWTRLGRGLNLVPAISRPLKVLQGPGRMSFGIQPLRPVFLSCFFSFVFLFASAAAKSTQCPQGITRTSYDGTIGWGTGKLMRP